MIPYGDRRLYSVACAEKGTFRFDVRARGVAGHAAVPGTGDNALLKLAPVISPARRAPAASFDVVDEARALLTALGEDPAIPRPRSSACAPKEPRLAPLRRADPVRNRVPTIFASEKINVIPARPSCWSTAACRRAWAG